MPKAATFESIQEIYVVLKFDRKKLTSDRYYSLSKTWMLNDTCCQWNEKTIHKYSRTHNLPYPMVLKIGRQRQPYMQAYRKFMGFFSSLMDLVKDLTSDRYYSLSNAWMLNDPCCQGHDKTIHKSCCSCPIGLASWFIYSFNCITYTLCLIYVNLFC